MDSSSNWRTENKGALARALYLLDNGKWSDCEFLVGETPCQEVVTAHKLYLISSSPVFETMFLGSIPAEGDEPIKVPEIRPEAFKAMLKFIYTDELPPLHLELAGDLNYCAKKYMLPDVTAKCTNYLCSILSPENVCRIHEIAEFYEESDLSGQCLELMRTETRKILTNKSWEDAARTTVSILFEQNMLAIDLEIDLYQALLVWAKAECRRRSLAIDQESLRSVSGDLVTKIRFLTMTPEAFANGPGKAEILNKDEILAIVMNKLSANSNISIPEGISVETNCRLTIPDDEWVRCASVMRIWTFGPTADDFPRFIDYRCNYSASPKVQRNSSVYNPGDMKRCLSFRVDRRIEIHGLIVSAQTKLDSHGLENSYSEQLYACLSDDSSRQSKVESSYSGIATFGSIVHMRFNQSMTVKSEKDYRICIEFRKPGTYPVENIVDSSTCEQVHFTFYSSAFQTPSDYPLQGIVCKVEKVVGRSSR